MPKFQDQDAESDSKRSPELSVKLQNDDSSSDPKHSTEFSEKLQKDESDPKSSPGLSEKLQSDESNPKRSPELSEKLQSDESDPKRSPELSENLQNVEPGPKFSHESSVKLRNVEAEPKRSHSHESSVELQDVEPEGEPRSSHVISTHESEEQEDVEPTPEESFQSIIPENDFLSFMEHFVPTLETPPVISPHDFLPSVQLKNFEYKVKRIQKQTVIYNDVAWNPYRDVRNICLDGKEKSVILTDLPPLPLDAWEKLQTESIAEVKRYLEEEWYELVVSSLKDNLSKVEKSWYNLNEPDYDVFLLSKLSNFLQLIKIILQDTIRSVVTESCYRLLKQVKSFAADIGSNTEWTWGDDLLVSEFPPPAGTTPLWTIEIYLDPTDGPKYTPPLQSFSNNVYLLIVKAIESCAELPTLMMKVMPQMQFAALGFLKGVDLNELEMVELGEEVMKCAERICLPLESYLRKYSKYEDVWTIDIQDYVKKLEEANPTAVDIRKLVVQQRRQVLRLEREIPSEIKITAFRVVIDPVRDGILKKKKSLINAILDSYAFKLRQIVQKVQKDFHEMEKKLTIRSDDIEEVMELKDYVEIVPSLVSRLETISNAVIKDYDVFDHFMYQVTNDDVNGKWLAALNSNKMLRLAREATRWLEEDYDRLLKVQQLDLSTLSDQVDAATLTVAGLAAYTELEKAKEVCEKIKNIWETIKELQEQSELLNKRQKIFGLAVSQNEALHRLSRDIEPFKNLWFTANEWLTIQDALKMGTLDRVDVDQITKVISEGGKVIGKCIKYFAGADQIQQIAQSIKHELQEFKPLVPIITTLKKPELRQRHWQAITDVCGFTVLAQQQFKQLLDQGIQRHMKQIFKIGELATKEFEVESAVDKMINGLAQHQVEISHHAEYNMPIVIISRKTVHTIAAYTQTTKELLKNPYNGPFKEKLTTWDSKLNYAKVHLEIWKQLQARWISMQPTFMAPDVATKMPVSYKLYERIKRVWRRLIRLARDTQEVQDLASDNTTVASLQQFGNLMNDLDKSLEEYMRPKGSDESDDD